MSSDSEPEYDEYGDKLPKMGDHPSDECYYGDMSTGHWKKPTAPATPVPAGVFAEFAEYIKDLPKTAEEAVARRKVEEARNPPRAPRKSKPKLTGIRKNLKVDQVLYAHQVPKPTKTMTKPVSKPVPGPVRGFVSLEELV